MCRQSMPEAGSSAAFRSTIGKRMKQILISLIALTSVIAFASGQIEGAGGYLTDGTAWSFKIVTGEVDRWDSTTSDHPPLSPKKAKDLASDFMNNVPLDAQMIAWDLTQITLKKMNHEPEHWVYFVDFRAVPDPELGPWNGPLPWFIVFVRMDGSIPEPKIEKQEKTQ